MGKPYWYGTFGHKASESLLRQKAAQYPQYYKDDDFIEQYGLKVHDCSGLVKGYIFSDTADAFYNPNNYTAEVDGSIKYEKCTEKGDISTIPDMPGIIVFMPGHVGVYIGNGKVIEARGHDYGVVETNLIGRGWTQWGKCQFLEYIETVDDKFEVGDELKAIDYLVAQGRITNKELALKKLDTVKDENWIFIKWANDVKALLG